MRKFPAARSNQPIERDVYSVDRLNREARQLLESRFAQVWVEGEISNLSTPRSGHLYFTLKDADAQIRCAFFRNRRALFDYVPAAGAQVLMRARLTVFEPRGDLQLVVQHMEPAGEGALRERFERLKRALEQEGLFDAERKTPPPAIPRAIGVITSPTGAAIRDIISTCRRRFPAIPLVLYPTEVQGESAAAGIVESLRVAERRKECGVLILARGGGGLEDLWAFNDERVARAMAGCRIPIVTGIGHEIDFTIADFVADRRAPTPTAAAEMVTPDASVLERRLRANANALWSALNRRIELLMQRNDLLAHRLLHPTRRYAQAGNALQMLWGRLVYAARRALEDRNSRWTSASQRLEYQGPRRQLERTAWRAHDAHQRLQRLAGRLVSPHRQRFLMTLGRLNAISPLATLERGYAMVTDRAGRVVTGADQVPVRSVVDVRLSRGGLRCRVEDKLD